MSNLLLTDVRFLFDGTDLSGEGNQIEIGETLPMLDATTFGNTAKINRPGFPEGKFSYAGVTQFGIGSVEAVLDAHRNALTIPILSSPTGDTGDHCHFLLATDSDFEVIKGKAGDLCMFTVSGVSASGMGGILDGAILDDGRTVRTSPGAGTIIGLAGPTSGQSAYAIIQVLAVNASALTLTIQSSPLTDFTDFGTNRFQLTGISATGGTWFVPLPGPITDTLWQLSWSGTFTSFQASAAIAVR